MVRVLLGTYASAGAIHDTFPLHLPEALLAVRQHCITALRLGRLFCAHYRLRLAPLESQYGTAYSMHLDI